MKRAAEQSAARFRFGEIFVRLRSELYRPGGICDLGRPALHCRERCGKANKAPAPLLPRTSTWHCDEEAMVFILSIFDQDAV